MCVCVWINGRAPAAPLTPPLASLGVTSHPCAPATPQPFLGLKVSSLRGESTALRGRLLWKVSSELGDQDGGTSQHIAGAGAHLSCCRHCRYGAFPVMHGTKRSCIISLPWHLYQSPQWRCHIKQHEMIINNENREGVFW